MSEKLVGGWIYNQNSVPCDMPQDAATAFSNAIEGIVGIRFTPVLYVGKQLVAGCNYCVICRTQLVTAEEETGYKVLYIYEDLNHNASISRIEDVIR